MTGVRNRRRAAMWEYIRVLFKAFVTMVSGCNNLKGFKSTRQTTSSTTIHSLLRILNF